MLGSDIIREVSLDLNDQEPGHEYTRWTEAQLAAYLREAANHVSQYMRDWFLEDLTVKVEPGGDWQTACNCSKILRIYGESDGKGKVFRNLRRVDDVERDVWPGVFQRCVPVNQEYKMESYTINSTEENQFKVFPPVPSNETRYVSLVCYKRPDGDASSDVPEEAVMAVKQWMLYRALSVDSENSPAIIQLADKHRSTFFELVRDAHKLNLEEEARYGSVRTQRNEAAE